MSLSKPLLVIVGLFFAAASVAIHYEVKVRLHESEESGVVTEMGNLRVGEAAPEFSLDDLANQTVTLTSFRGDRVVVLDFWATWCAPCRMAMPALQTLHRELKDRGLEIVGVNQAESADRVRNFLKLKRYTFRTVLDQRALVAHDYGVRAIPALVVVDKHGVIRRIQAGYTKENADLRRLLEKLLQEP